jgi:hypothetical protein
MLSPRLGKDLTYIVHWTTSEYPHIREVGWTVGWVNRSCVGFEKNGQDDGAGNRGAGCNVMHKDYCSHRITLLGSARKNESGQRLYESLVGHFSLQQSISRYMVCVY